MSSFPERATLGGIVDLVTGRSAIQVSDFELPFGGAVFRHIRTSGDASFDRIWPYVLEDAEYDTDSSWTREAAFWDWAGQGWMISSSPLLLIDAAYEQLSYPEGTRVSYFIPNAHHCVPFVKRNTPTGATVYEAPDDFDASLTVSGDEYVVSVLGGALRYTFIRQNDLMFDLVGEWDDPDCPPSSIFEDGQCRISAHELPPNGLGVPYYGFLDHITDRNGNRVQLYYRSPLTSPQNEEIDCDNLDTTCCRECCQRCNERGAPVGLKLFPAASQTAAWSILYTYRPFAPASICGNQENVSGVHPEFWHMAYQQHIHSVHVYQGDLPELGNGVPFGPVTISPWYFYPNPALPGAVSMEEERIHYPQGDFEYSFNVAMAPIHSLDEYEAETDPTLLRSLPDDWTHEVRYFYEEPDVQWYDEAPHDSHYKRMHFEGQSVQGTFARPNGMSGGQYSREFPTPNLLRVRVRTVDGPGANPQERNTIYFYSPDQGAQGLDNDTSENFERSRMNACLDAVLDNDTIDAIVNGARLDGRTEFNVNSIFTEPKPGSNGLTPYMPIGQGEVQHRRLRELCSAWMRDYYLDEVLLPSAYSLTSLTAIRQFGLDDQRVAYSSNRGRRVVIDRRGDAAAFYRLTYLVQSPATLASPPGPESTTLGQSCSIGNPPWIRDSAYFPPFRLLAGPSAQCQLMIPPQHEPLWITLIEELDTDRTDISAPDFRYWLSSWDDPIRSVRVVQMNPRGFVLSDTTWKVAVDADGNQSLDLASGSLDEQRVYDDKGRVIELRTRGWTTANEQSVGVDQGLIEVFEYDTLADADGERGELIRRGVKKGTDGEPIWIHEVERHPVRSDLIISETRYPAPGDIANKENVMTFYEGPNGAALDEESPIRRKTTIRGGSSRTHDGPDAFAAEVVVYDEAGNQTHRGLASVPQHNSLDNPMEFTFDRTQFDSALGWILESSVDSNVAAGAPPGFARVHELPPLNQTTTYTHNTPYGLERVQFPNGREKHVKYRTISDDGATPASEERLEQWVFSDVVPHAGGSAYIASPIEVTSLSGFQTEWKKSLTRRVLPNAPPEPFDITTADEIAEIKPKYDANGRVVGISASGDGADLSASMLYHSSGQPARTVAPDGTMTRNVYDRLGRLTHTYRGTDDTHSRWGAPPRDPYSDPPYPDDLVLIEKRAYGAGIHDVGELAQVRSYRNKPANQYNEEPDPNADPPIPPNNEDAIGWVVETGYDWRMRPVSTVHYRSGPSGAAAVVERHTLTWLDNLDRVRFSAEFARDATGGGGVVDLGAVDPRSSSLLGLPTASAILAAAQGQPLKLIAFSESIYNLRGMVEESRSYVPDTGEWTSTFTYYDHADRAIEVISPNSPIRRTVYDGKGRAAITRLVAKTAGGEVVVEETQSVFDADDRVVQTIQRERRADAAASPTGITPANSVATYNYTWYDIAGRVEATASFGTASAGGFVSVDPLAPPAYSATASPVTRATANDPSSAVVGCEFGGALAQAIVSCFDYDEAGRQAVVFHPDGSITRNEFDSFGRVRLTIENADPPIAGNNPPSNEQRRTAYEYDDHGRLTRVAAVLSKLDSDAGDIDTYAEVPWSDVSGDHVQITQFEYNADVVHRIAGANPGDPDQWHEVSESRSAIGAVFYPNPATGQPDNVRRVDFAYYPDGQLAHRVDARKMGIRYDYDELGRLSEVLVNDSLFYTAATVATHPPRRIQEIELTYDDGRLARATAGGVNAVGAMTVADTAFAYDSIGNLLTEWQSIGALAVTSGPGANQSQRVDYAWDFADFDSGNYNRLSQIKYPKRRTTNIRRLVDIGYGSVGDADDALSRIASITDLNSGAWAGFTYAGDSRRVATAYSNGATQTTAGSGGYPGLDRFGRIADLHFQRPDGSTIHRYQYNYDKSGNRTHAKVTHLPVAASVDAGKRSWNYQYDALQRLVVADSGQMPTPGAAISNLWLEMDWALDSLGRWAGAGTSPGLTLQGDLDGDGQADTIERSHDSDAANRLNAIGFSESYTAGGGSAAAGTTLRTYDIVGNLIADADYLYQYDAWNRLIEVRVRDAFDPALFTELGQLPAVIPPGSEPGRIVCRYSYDALGRMVTRHTLIKGTEDDYRKEEYYYDGVRRIAEAVERPGVVYLAPLDPLDPNSALEGIEPPVEGLPFVGQLLVIVHDASWDQREYVYGPDYVDELWLQIERDGSRTFTLQDANYNVVALLDDGQRFSGNSLPTGSSSTAPPTVLAQYVYTPYGELLHLDLPVPAGAGPEDSPYLNRVGFQGLFYENFYADDTQASMIVEGRGLYHARNRWYEPRTGTWTTADPYMTGLTIPTGAGYHGSEPAITVDSLPSGFADGANLYLAFGGNPLNFLDAMGLIYDPFEDVDEFHNDLQGNRIANLGALVDGAHLGLSVGVQILSSFLPGAGIYDAYRSGEGLFSGEVGFWDYVELGATLAPGAGMVLSKAFGWARKIYAGKIGQVGGRAATCLIANSVVLGTMVSTPAGGVPIELVQPGDWVYSTHEIGPGERTIPRRVSEVVWGVVDCVVWIALEDGQTLGLTSLHPVWTADQHWVAAEELCAGQELIRVNGGGTRIVDTWVEYRRQPVFNLGVAGTYTYFAADVWLHNCPRQWHHTVPQQILKALDPRVAAALNRSKIQWKIPEAQHKAIHGGVGNGYRSSGGALNPRGGGYNARWRAELHAIGGPERATTAQILEIRNRVARDFGLIKPDAEFIR
ncbi:MAG: polymorphic toxin-type HINT domain-containing protein [Phycisphaerae bacterium]